MVEEICKIVSEALSFGTLRSIKMNCYYVNYGRVQSSDIWRQQHKDMCDRLFECKCNTQIINWSYRYYIRILIIGRFKIPTL